MEKQNNNLSPAEDFLPLSSETSTPENVSAKKNKYWKFAIGFLAIIVLVAGGYWVWDNYLSPEARYARETQQNYEKFSE